MSKKRTIFAFRLLTATLLSMISVNTVYAGTSQNSAKRAPPAHEKRDLIDNSAYPWNAIGQLNFQGNASFCTGALVGPDVVLTAAQCLYSLRMKRWAVARSIHFVAGLRGQRYAFHARAISYRTAEGFDPKDIEPMPHRRARMGIRNISRDWAMVKLDASAGAEIGYLGVAVMTRSFDLPTAPNFVMAGYGEDRRYALAGDRHCRILRWDTSGQVVIHDCRAVGGTAGAPLIGVRDGRYYIYAVNSAGVDKRHTNNVAVSSFAFFEAVRDATKQNEMILEDGLLVLPGRAGKQ